MYVIKSEPVSASAATLLSLVAEFVVEVEVEVVVVVVVVVVVAATMAISTIDPVFVDVESATFTQAIERAAANSVAVLVDILLDE